MFGLPYFPLSDCWEIVKIKETTQEDRSAKRPQDAENDPRSFNPHVLVALTVDVVVGMQKLSF